MTDIIRNRTIRPSSRLETSKSYKIDTRTVSRGDILIVNIDHESTLFRQTYRFNGSDIAHKDSISFRVSEVGTQIDISWSGALPMGTKTSAPAAPATPATKARKLVEKNKTTRSLSAHTKTSFDPIADKDTTILILGTLPGDKSLELGEYYGHPRNRFWKILAAITGHDLPQTYAHKKEMLRQTKIGIWDIAHSASRKGSLDSAMKEEVPNDIPGFVTRHGNLKTIAFNGNKSEALYNKYFERLPGIHYITLPSTSPANAGITFDNICQRWKQILTH